MPTSTMLSLVFVKGGSGSSDEVSSVKLIQSINVCKRCMDCHIVTNLSVFLVDASSFLSNDIKSFVLSS